MKLVILTSHTSGFAAALKQTFDLTARTGSKMHSRPLTAPGGRAEIDILPSQALLRGKMIKTEVKVEELEE